jgi:hypothetical protein
MAWSHAGEGGAKSGHREGGPGHKAMAMAEPGAAVDGADLGARRRP